MCGCLSHTPPGDLACNPGMCPDWGLNQWPFGSQASAQFTQPHQPGHDILFFNIISKRKHAIVLYWAHIYRTCTLFLRFYLFIFREGKRGRKRGRETSMCGCLSHIPLLGTWPATQACALTGDWTSDPLVCRLVLNPLSYTSQGRTCIFNHYNIFVQ